jgi:hypothetical protein
MTDLKNPEATRDCTLAGGRMRPISANEEAALRPPRRVLAAGGTAAHPGPVVLYGSMFWLMWNRLFGSYLRLICVRRS